MKRVVITGASSGMGLAAAKLFAERNWDVLMVDLNEEGLAKAASELRQKTKVEVYTYAVNVVDENAVSSLANQIKAKFATIDSLINNAGIARMGSVTDTDSKTWDAVLNVDVKSVFLMSKYFVPLLIDNKGGTIVNTASISGLCGDFGMAAYNAAKGAVVNLVRSLALDFAKYNIRVNNVNPGATETPMFLQNPEEVQQQFRDAIPLGRLAKPEQIAKVMYFLASDESDPIDGVNLPVDGGLSIQSGQPQQ
ncbi:SDR family oxidoreductase [Sporolactobacillus sp. STSJ-5]|uniref:SDR family NAD(P)-dependent oxidoreductase n=1 Tax=Sporolactobacillus sp. STSJ-5 TaxID=2965076 RepID=UPI0021043F8E|nr:SDR family oxidoreductase [Sporolactobacillus sp. STSJ-5]MCQ2011078.1 SDR family oxidoreductase [Sporolactobacillus sp. STSJ-5]